MELNIRQTLRKLRLKIERTAIKSVCKAGVTMYDSFSLGHREVSGVRINRCPSVSRLILKKIYELFVGTNETVRNIRMFVLGGCP